MSATIIPIRQARTASCGRVHVWQHECYFEVIHESSSGESFGPIEHFSLMHRDEAIACALAWVAANPPCHLGSIAGDLFP